MNTSNLGGEVNLHKVLSYASGTYVFVLTDDDYLLPRAVAALVAFLVKYSTCGVVLSPLLNEDDRVNRITGAAFAVERDAVYGAGEAALSNLFWECHILSRLVVRRDLIDLEANHIVSRHFGASLDDICTHI